MRKQASEAQKHLREPWHTIIPHEAFVPGALSWLGIHAHVGSLQSPYIMVLLQIAFVTGYDDDEHDEQQHINNQAAPEISDTLAFYKPATRTEQRILYCKKRLRCPCTKSLTTL